MPYDRTQVTNAPHKAELSHELIAAAASYEAAKAYEKHVAANGKPDNHAQAKELLYVASYPLRHNVPRFSHVSYSAALSGGFIDRIVETKGLDFVDKEKAKHHAKVQAEEGLNSHPEWQY